MSVTTTTAGDLFIFRVTKYHQLNPDRKWANSYEFKVIEGSTEGSLLTLGAVLVNFESKLHLASTVFDRLLVSTWQPDSVPYDPETFISTSLTAIGTNPSGSNPIGLTQPLTVVRSAPTGRSGHLFYRNVLTEDIVSSPAGKTILDSRSDLQTLINGALTASGLEAYIGEPPDEGLQLVMVNADGTQVRPVIQLRAQGVTTLPLDHKWFNRRRITVP